MKVLIDHKFPFFLAHGGVQKQIEETKGALEAIGVEVEPLRWWDLRQTGDLIHFFAAPPVPYLKQAHVRHIPVIATVMLSETCNRPDWKLAVQGLLIAALLGQPFGNGLKEQLNAKAYRLCSQLIVGLDAERTVLVKAFGVHPSAVSVVPLGLSQAFLKAGPGPRNQDHLICPGTIYPVKRSVELAMLAKAARVPILFVGKPYDTHDPYWRRFESLIDGRYVKYQAHEEKVDSLIRLLQTARGFVLFSKFENWSLAASEAVACSLPLLVPDRKWSRERFGNQVKYFGGDRSSQNIAVLQQFYRDCPGLSAPRIKLLSWPEVAGQLKSIYEGLLKTSR